MKKAKTYSGKSAYLALELSLVEISIEDNKEELQVLLRKKKSLQKLLKKSEINQESEGEHVKKAD